MKRYVEYAIVVAVILVSASASEFLFDTGWTTALSIAFIVAVFTFFSLKEYELNCAKKALKSLLDTDNILDAVKETDLAAIGASYGKTINIETGEGMKSNMPASEYINDISVCKCYALNLRIIDTASGTLVGLGLLGTFLGLTIGIGSFDSSNTEKINESIQGLLSGMGTAFTTSLFGMGFSLIFIYMDKAIRHSLYKHINSLTEKLDSLYYIDDLAVANLNQQRMFNNLYAALKEDIRQHTSAIISKLTYNNADGENVSVGNAIREILTENTKQSKALMSFSTDLAIELNQGFDETLSRQMQQKIVPLMESVDATTKAVVEHIDQMAETVSSPAADMMQGVIDELKRSMQSLMGEFSSGLSGSATAELENLAGQLGIAAQAMTEFPKNMENISTTLQVTIEEVKHAISDISSTSANANSTAMQQMQEQITFATTAISNAIAEVKDVMAGISKSSQQQSDHMVSKLADAAEKMGTFLSGTVSTLSSSVQQSVKGITDEVNSRQADLIALQEDTTSQTKRLLDSFNVGLERLEKMNEYVTGTMNGFKLAQGEITVSTSNLRSISGDMKTATEIFNKGQNDYAARLAQLQAASQNGIDQVTAVLKESGEMSDEYVKKFEVIRQGIGSIFAQLQNGLTEYSRTVKDTTDKYLAQYTSSLTQTTGALASAIERQNEVTEMLTDTISRNRR